MYVVKGYDFDVLLASLGTRSLDHLGRSLWDINLRCHISHKADNNFWFSIKARKLR